MIDLHCHILPAVDDGAIDFDEALAMCRMAWEDGCTAMVATPHLRHERWWNGDRVRLEGTWSRLRQLVADRLEVFLGGEIAVNSQSLQELALLPDCDLFSLAGSRYLLLELDQRQLGPNPEELIHELTVQRWVPVLAHPERISWLASDLSYLRHLVDVGALLQLTAMSVTGEMGRLALEAASRMLDAEMVHFIASDAHDTRIRLPGLSRAYRRVAEDRGEDRAIALFVSNPRAVLANRPLTEPEDADRRSLTGAARSLEPADSSRVVESREVGRTLPPLHR